MVSNFLHTHTHTHTHTYTHTHTHIYIYICVCVCVIQCFGPGKKKNLKNVSTQRTLLYLAQINEQF
jgi:hypothetical protein